MRFLLPLPLTALCSCPAATAVAVPSDPPAAAVSSSFALAASSVRAAGMGSAARGSRLLRLMRDYPQLVAEMEEQFERRAQQISAATAAPHASTMPTAAAANSSAASSHASLVLLPSAHRARLDTLRDHALVPGTIALVLSFVPIRRRIHLGRVCRRWQSSLQQPSLWVGSGWHGYLHQEDLTDLPSIMARHLAILRCGVDWLLRTNLLKALRRVPQLRRLDVLHCLPDRASTTTIQSLRATLRSLRLEALTLPPLDGDHCRVLVEALAASPSHSAASAAAVESQAAASSSLPSPPLFARWAPALTELRLFIPADSDGLLLRALAELHWPVLRYLAIWLTKTKNDTAEPEKAAQLLQQAVSPKRMPELQTLHCDRYDPYLTYEEPDAFSLLAWLPIIPRLFMLTVLTIGAAICKPRLSALTLFRIIGAHNLPSLHTLRLQAVMKPLDEWAEREEVDQILERMDSLTNLHVGSNCCDSYGDWLHSMSLLPSLHTLSVDDFGAGEGIRFGSPEFDIYMQSISEVPKLQSLSFSSGQLIARLAHLWWRQLGKPQLDLSGIEDGRWKELQEWLSDFDDDYETDSMLLSPDGEDGEDDPDPSSLSPDAAPVAVSAASAAPTASVPSAASAASAGSAASAAPAALASPAEPAALAATSSSPSIASSVPAIRELHLSRHCSVTMDGCALAYLAHLPHLHTLDCALQAVDLSHLALLRQLRSLTLWLHDNEQYWLNGAPWTAAAVRVVGSSRLPLLHTLRLEGDDEYFAPFTRDPADPNFNWEWDVPAWSEEMDAPRRARHVAMPVDNGLDHLLRLPALTRLALPYVDRDAMDQLRSIAADDRPALLIERIIPHSRRSYFDKRWIEHGSPAFPRESD